MIKQEANIHLEYAGRPPRSEIIGREYIVKKIVKTLIGFSVTGSSFVEMKGNLPSYHHNIIPEEKIIIQRKALWFFGLVFILSVMLALSLGYAQAQTCTPGHIVKFTPSCTDTDSVITESAGNIGIGTIPTAEFQVQGTTVSSSGTTMTATSGATTFTTSANITINAGDYVIPTLSPGQARSVTVGGTGTSFTVTPAFTATLTDSFTIYKSITNLTNDSGTSALFVQGSTGKVGIGTMLSTGTTNSSWNWPAYARANVQGPGPQQGTGKIIGSASSTLVTGTAACGMLDGTCFTSQLHVGDAITVSGQTRIVTAISDDTHLTIHGYFASNLGPANFTFQQPIIRLDTPTQSGVGTISSSGTTVTGSGTSFNVQVHVGDSITAGTQTRVVMPVTVPPCLPTPCFTTDTPFNPTLSNASFTIQPPPPFIVHSSGHVSIKKVTMGQEDTNFSTANSGPAALIVTGASPDDGSQGDLAQFRVSDGTIKTTIDEQGALKTIAWVFIGGTNSAQQSNVFPMGGGGMLAVGSDIGDDRPVISVRPDLNTNPYTCDDLPPFTDGLGHNCPNYPTGPYHPQPVLATRRAANPGASGLVLPFVLYNTGKMSWGSGDPSSCTPSCNPEKTATQGLDVHLSRDNVSGGKKLRLQGGGFGMDNNQSLLWQNSAGTAWLQGFGVADGNVNIGRDTGLNINQIFGRTEFYNRAGTSAVNMEITDTGLVGIGTSAPSVKLHVIGDFMATGAKTALVETASYGKRKLYAMESPGNWFEDFGSAQLEDGEAIVRIDDIFAQTVNMDQRYHVFLTPNGNCTLYVKVKTADSFTVLLRDGEPDCEFDYRIIAKRKGFEGIRLEEVKDVESK